MDDIKVLHNSHDLKYRNPFGAVKLDQPIKISILLNKKAIVYLHLISFDGKEKDILMREYTIDQEGFLYNVELRGFEEIGLMKYYFKVATNTEVVYYGNSYDGLGGCGEANINKPKPFQITVYKDWNVPEWYKDGIIYQIFVDRFNNGNESGLISNPKKNCFIYGNWDDEPMYIKDREGKILRWDFYGGNLRGIINKLQYIKDLGASIIYMNPIFESSSCHKYDTGDYEKIDSMFGSEEDFKELCQVAETMGIRIILDGVFSHTGADSKYFNKFSNYQELGAFQSPKSQYYSWYRFENYPDKYECWWGIDNQPNVDELNQNYVNYIISNENSIIKKWLRLGASGWRLDVADELPDKFIKLIKEAMRQEKEESVLIGEVWEDASNKVSYSEEREYLFGDELDSVTNYPFRNSILGAIKGEVSSYQFMRQVMSIYENYPLNSFFGNMNLLGNHDTERILTMLNENIDKLKLAIVLQMSLPGVPLIYYGDEAGLTGGKDPLNRKSYPWNKVNNKIFNIYKNLISIRKNNVTLVKGALKFYESSDNIIIFERAYEKDKTLVIINVGEEARKIKINNINSYYKDTETGTEYSPVGATLDINLASLEYKILNKIKI